MAAALMSSKDPEERKRGAALLGQAKTRKKRAASKANGEMPKRKRKSDGYLEQDHQWKFKVA